MNRFFELIAALFLLLLFSPIFLIIAILIKLDSKGPIFFTQERYTQFVRPFKMLKFRTMRVENRNPEKEALIASGNNDSRITRVGAWLRKHRLDELPQLINVIKGDIHFVGSRPQVKRYIDYYPELYKESLVVKSGITGLAPIKLHQLEEALLETSPNPEQVYIEKILPKKLRYDIFYAQHKSLKFDLLIICWTLKKVFELRML